LVDRSFILARILEKERESAFIDLKAAHPKIKKLSGLLPICAAFKKIRDEKGDWRQMEIFIRDHSEAEFSQSLCPECVQKWSK
jgi:hypothetical protein